MLLRQQLRDMVIRVGLSMLNLSEWLGDLQPVELAIGSADDEDDGIGLIDPIPAQLILLDREPTLGRSGRESARMFAKITK